jgi:hypothetical protein
MKRSFIALPFCLIIAIAVIAVIEVSAQDDASVDTAGSAATVVSQEEPAADAQDENVSGQESEPDQKTLTTQKPVQPAAKQTVNTVPVKSPKGTETLSLLDTNDDNFRSARIQGMTFSKKTPSAAGEVKADTAEKKKEQSSVVKKGSLKKLAPVITVIAVLVLIVFMYRFGKKKKRGNVFRRFP